MAYIQVKTIYYKSPIALMIAVRNICILYESSDLP